MEAGGGCRVLLAVVTALFSAKIVSMFISSESPAHAIATKGLPLFAIGFVPFAVNMISIGYFQSVERIKAATVRTILRGFAFVLASFILLPKVVGDVGAWLAVPMSEVLTMVVVLVFYLKNSER